MLISSCGLLKASGSQIYCSICSSECDKISSLSVFYVDEKFTHQIIYFNTKSSIFLCQAEILYIKFITLLSVANFFSAKVHICRSRFLF